MAWIRLESKYTGGGAQYDGVCELTADLTAAASRWFRIQMGTKCTERCKHWLVLYLPVWWVQVQSVQRPAGVCAVFPYCIKEAK